MNNTTPDSYFDALEAHFHQLALAVATGDTDALPLLSEQLQQMAVTLSTVWRQWQRQGLASPQLGQRVKDLADSMQVVRAHVLRRATLVEQALNLVIPATVETTYAGNSAYGSGPKASGRMSRIAA